MSHRTGQVQGGALLSVGEAHNKLFPVSAKSGEGVQGKRFAPSCAASLLPPHGPVTESSY